MQRIQELAPPKGIAVMTISSLLDGLKTTSHQISLKPPPANSLPILAINNFPHQNNKSQLSPLKTAEKSINTNSLEVNIINNYEQMCNNCKTITLINGNTNTMKKYCDKQTSPTRYFKSGNLSFSDLQLECMCSQSDDIERYTDDNEHHTNDCRTIDCCNIDYDHPNYQNPVLRRSLKYRHSDCSLDESNFKCTKHENLINDRRKENLKDEKSNINNENIILGENILSDHKRSKKRKFHSSCSLIQSKSINSSPCDNHKSNEHFLICDNCKSKIVHSERRNEIKVDSQKFQSLSSPSSSSYIIPLSSTTGLVKSQIVSIHDLQKLPQHKHQQHLLSSSEYYQKKNLNDDGDDISFHSSNNDDDYTLSKFDKSEAIAVQINQDKKNFISEIDDDLNVTPKKLSKHYQSNIESDENQQQQQNIEEYCCSGGDGDGGENVNNTNTKDPSSSSSNTSGLKKGKNNRKSEKLVLDLNDRSKYTKEVSV